MSHSIVVREKTDEGYMQFDTYSRLFEDRIIYLDTEFHDAMASIIVSQLLILSNKDPKADITINILSPGGSVMSGLAIYDTMQTIPNDVKTIVTGQAASMGAFILSGGTKGKRFAQPNSRIMIHQVSGGARGTTKDMAINFEEQKKLNDRLNEMLGKHCGKTAKQIEDATDRDKWMSPEEAIKFGLIDKVLEPHADSKAW